jgi:O-antigen/teichoic acid export membrane protein
VGGERRVPLGAARRPHHRAATVNSAAVFVAQIINKISTFAAFYIVSLALSVHDLGLYTLVLAIGEIFSSVASFGLDGVLVRMLAQADSRGGSKRLLRDATVIKIVSSVLAGALAVSLLYALGYATDVVIGTGIAMGDVLLVNVASTLVSYYRARLRSTSITGIQTIVRVGYVGLLLLGVFMGASWLLLLTVLLLADAVLCTALAFKLRPRLGSVALTGGPARRRMFAEALPLGLASIAILAYTRIDTLLIAQMRGASEVAYYTVAYKLTEAPLIFITSIAATALPMISAWSATDARAGRVAAAAHRALRYSYLVALPIAVALSLFASDLIALIYGATFLTIVPAMTVLAWAMVAMASNIITASVLTAVGRQRALAAVTGLNLAINLGVNLWAIPRWGYFGSAMATTATEGVNMLVQVAIVCIALRRPRLAVGALLALLVGSATLVARMVMGIEPTTAQSIGILAALLILLIVFRFITRDDLARLGRVLRKRRRERTG